MEPVLVGYSSGATLAYITLAQSPASCRGAISRGFAPDLYNQKPYCHNVEFKSHPADKARGFVAEPSANLATPWIVLQGLQDQVANPDTTRAFAGQIYAATLIELPKVGHGYAVFPNWWPQFEKAYRSLISTPPAAARLLPAGGVSPRSGLDDLPLVSVVDRAAPTTDSFAIFLSGDGGWADFDQALAAAFAARGVPVVGWSTLWYFWSAKSPAQSARDLSRAITHFGTAWGKHRVVLVGYSFGAETLPFMVEGLPANQQGAIAAVALISPGREARFDFSPLDWLDARRSGLPTLPAIVKLDPLKSLCIYGAEDHDSICPALPKGASVVMQFPGGHHLGGAYDKLTTAILGHPGG